MAAHTHGGVDVSAILQSFNFFAYTVRTTHTKDTEVDIAALNLQSIFTEVNLDQF